MIKWLKKYWKDIAGLIVVVLLVMFVFRVFAAESHVEAYTGEGTKDGCITVEEFNVRLSALEQSMPGVASAQNIDTEALSNKTKELVAAINTVMGPGTIKDGDHFQTIFLPTSSGKIAMINIGSEAGSFCRFVEVSTEQVLAIGKLVVGDPA